MIHDFLYALWFFMPAGFANAVPVLVANLPGLSSWNTPLDFGRSYQGQRVFGASKTWRGLICAAIAATGLFALQQRLAPHLGGFSAYLTVQHYGQLPIILGLLLGVGALLGDAAESFIKRRRGIGPSQGWFPFDQLDYIVGGCLLSLPVVILSPALYLWIAVSWFGLHLIFSHIGYVLHLKS